MSGRLLDYDPLTRTKRIFHYDPTTGGFVIETLQDVEDIVESDKASFRSVDERAGWKGDMHRVASIPMNIYAELARKGIADDEKALRRWLNDPDNRVFRTRPGKV